MDRWWDGIRAAGIGLLVIVTLVLVACSSGGGGASEDDGSVTSATAVTTVPLGARETSRQRYQERLGEITTAARTCGTATRFDRLCAEPVAVHYEILSQEFDQTQRARSGRPTTPELFDPDYLECFGWVVAGSLSDDELQAYVDRIVRRTDVPTLETYEPLLPARSVARRKCS